MTTDKSPTHRAVADTGENKMTSLSYGGSAVLKAEHIAHAEHHAAADMLLAGTYGEQHGDKFMGCSVGCLAHDINPLRNDYHRVVAERYALPEWLIHLQDSMFEGLPKEDRSTFHVELAKRIPVGVNLEPVQHWIAIARIDRALELQNKALEANHPHGVHEAIQQTIAALAVGRRAHEAAAGGDLCELGAASRSAAEAAAEAAWSAARSASWSASWSASRSAAWRSERDALFAALDRAGGA